ncbi:MAG: hypothetical protein KDC84_14940, partial [Crocinitomicaceae bacterium]|nr:hypothetical protein [Crocinitomicaceae bacterium]
QRGAFFASSSSIANFSVNLELMRTKQNTNLVLGRLFGAVLFALFIWVLIPSFSLKSSSEKEQKSQNHQVSKYCELESESFVEEESEESKNDGNFYLESSISQTDISETYQIILNQVSPKKIVASSLYILYQNMKIDPLS